jgi:hypothetical protein
MGLQPSVAFVLLGLGRVAQDQGDFVKARSLFGESLKMRRDQGDRRGIPNCLESLARVAAAQQQFDRAARLYGAGQAQYEAIGLKTAAGPRRPSYDGPVPARFMPLMVAVASPSAQRAEYEASVSAIRKALRQEAFTRAWEAGRGMALDEAIAEALGDSLPG